MSAADFDTTDVDRDVLHSKRSDRSPAQTGDVTVLNGEVAEHGEERSGAAFATVRVVMTNQRDEGRASGEAGMRLPAAP
jgi:hypothetical protein